MAKAIIDDVAELAGVSIKTVSRVVNNEPNVRPEMREKVLHAIAQLDYRPNMSARSLAGNRSYLLGFLYGIPSAHYVLDIQEGVLATCRPQRYELIVHPCDHKDANLIDEVSSLIRNSRIDGVILTPPLSDNLDLLAALKQLSIPFVRVAPTLNKELSAYVETNDSEASYDMTRQLIEMGHTRIGFINGHPDHRAVGLRFEGYKAAMAEEGIVQIAELIADGDSSFDSGIRCAQHLLAINPRPTAIFAANDEMAAGVLLAAHQIGIKIPDELSVAGFDDTPVAHQIWPALTTIRQPIQGMAKKATELLIKQLKKSTLPLSANILPSMIVNRESTGRIIEK